MKPKGLMLGDWISSNYSFEGRKIFKVSEIYHKGVITDMAIPLLWDEIEPIPIDENILKKNGFNGDVYATLVIDKERRLEYYTHENRLELRYKGIDEWENHKEVDEVLFKCRCVYIHELQHALRLCNIDKDIIL